MEEKELIGLLAKYQNSQTVEKLKNSLRDKTILEIMGVGRKEVPHSNFLAWLFNPEETHGLGYFAITKLLLILATNDYLNTERMPTWLQYNILSGGLKILSAEVKTEVITNVEGKNKDGRVDIVIPLQIQPLDCGRISSVNIVLENKIFSSENGKDGEQTKIYYNYFESIKSASQQNIYVYLTPAGHADSSDEHFIHITYQEILDTILMPATEKPELSKRVYNILSEYIKNLSITMDSKNSTPIAMTKEQRELLINFWNENESLIKASIIAIAEDSGSDCQGEAQEVRTAIENLEAKKKHNSRFKFEYKGEWYQGPFGQGRLVHAIIKTYTEKEHCTFSELEKQFPFSLQNQSKKPKSEPYGCVKLVNQVAPKSLSANYFSKSDDIITLQSGEKIVVCCQWGTLDDENGEPTRGNFPVFRNHAEKLGFKVIEL